MTALIRPARVRLVEMEIWSCGGNTETSKEGIVPIGSSASVGGWINGDGSTGVDIDNLDIHAGPACPGQSIPMDGMGPGVMVLFPWALARKKHDLGIQRRNSTWKLLYRVVQGRTEHMIKRSLDGMARCVTDSKEYGNYIQGRKDKFIRSRNSGLA